MAEKMIAENCDDEVVVVNNIRKEFLIPHERRTTLFEDLSGVFRPNTYEKFVALKDINFSVKRGEAIGIIGDNGSGKSTLLKILAGIIKPTSGSIDVKGRITPFLELGVGFQQDLTARENIEIYSTIMGMHEREIQKNIDSVLEFAGLANFQDTKLRNFSSGMQVRLAFATAIQTVPEILLVDEVLAVGDMDFQQKCLDIFSEYRKRGITILFVSHDLSSVRRFCDKTLLIKRGEQVAFGKTNEVIDRYVYGADQIDQVYAIEGKPEEPGKQCVPENRQPAESVQSARDRWGSQQLSITNVKFLDKYGHENTKFNTGDEMVIRIDYHANQPVDNPVFGIMIYTDTDLLCYGTNTEIQGLSFGRVDGAGSIFINIPTIPFVSSRLMLTVAAHTKDNKPFDWHDKKYSFSIISTGRVIGLFDLNTKWADGR